MKNQTVALTGSTGYVGSRIMAFLEGQGVTVVPIGRHSKRCFHLGETPQPSLFEGVETIIHCAYDFSVFKPQDIYRVNVQGTIRLLKAAKDAGVKIIFISSISAFDGCRSHYGKAKWEVEQVVKNLGGVVIRPGLVFGPEPGGMLRALVKMISLSPVLPLLGNGKQPIYLCYEGDLGRAIWKILSQTSELPKTPLIAAFPRPLVFRDLLRSIAKANGKNTLFIPIPWRFIWAGLKTIEAVGIRLRLRSDSLIGLLFQDPHPDFNVASSLDISFQGFDGKVFSK